MAGQSINQETMVLMQLSRDLIGILEHSWSLTEDKTTAIKRHLSGLQRALDLGREDFNRMSQEERIDTVIKRLKKAMKMVERLRKLAREVDGAR